MLRAKDTKGVSFLFYDDVSAHGDGLVPESITRTSYVATKYILAG